MAHSIELIFDAETDATITSQWDALTAAGLPSQGRTRSESNRPHVTLIAADSIDGSVDRDLATLTDLPGMEVNIGAMLLFRGRRATAARLVVPSSELCDLHAHVFELSRGHISGEPLPHIQPGAWTPHVTLARRLADDQIGYALTTLGFAPEIFTATVTGLRRWNSDTREEFYLL
ncbi:2'-5' RNA ligase superfamily protein [Williamsia limnetica]|uniref:2'-5' RNA ligase superfamily protein n=1 Tax=Williamsia limnetica TaxID=882452 RepID=A0A318RZP9_WILLI|nr:2'-5' RNA ligase family protein [Williamsia limnetica]PYE16008.1 2'-5' RNA ligase superfamily protein [Williamsia limnetica]